MTPAFRIIATNTDVTATIADRLISLSVTDEDGLSADTLRLKVDDRDGRIAAPETGVVLDVALGHAGQPLVPVGRFAVDRVRGTGMPQTLTIDATAADMTGPLRAPRSRGWTDQTLGQIVETIAGRVGLEPVVAAALAGIRYPFLAQTAESDLNFLTRIARTLDATAKPAAGRLVVIPRGTGRDATGVAIPPVAIDRTDLSDWSWDRGARKAYARVTAEWCDIAGGRTVKVTVGSGEPVHRLRHVYATAADAQRACAAELAMSDRARLTLDGTLHRFNGDLFAGGTIRMTGLRAELNGGWLIRKVTHELTGALTTSFSADRGADQTAP
ncbi:phage tail protein [Loktanella sp. TSTF-M6]|uniref:Phage tail protein n=1 Tax=Loktanella gaetbuli TaxID=2881335 RepID=A0ABS8BS95_9RHOB|nr:contractile injection system protein, VgrG/Pvc8 family [Loktanella gaetbuli]MCB5198610.1 phage tail protein [Loktanella gaetbuli]